MTDTYSEPRPLLAGAHPSLSISNTAADVDVAPAGDHAPPWWRRLLRAGARPMFLAGDVAALALASVLLGPFWPYVLGLGVLVFVLFATAGLYRSRLSLSLLDDLPRILGRFSVAAITSVVIALVLALNGYGPSGSLQEKMQALVFVGPAALVLLLVAARAVVYALVRRLRSREVVAHRTVVVGTDEIARDLVLALRNQPAYGLQPIGHVESLTKDHHDTELPILGDPRDLSQILERHQAHVVIVSFGLGPETTLLQVIRMAHRHRADVFVVPRLHELHPVAEDVENVWGIPLVRLRRAAYRTPGWRLKRAVDVVVSAAALVVLSPVLAACALAVRLDGGPGVIFRQTRVGVDGRTFEVLKFRSMRPESEHESATTWTIAHDDRVSRTGRILRRTSLDELPQLWNILRGDMSLVGPRPERPHFVHQFAALYPSYGARHRVPCGLTGWAQVNGLRGGDTSIADRARFDNFYVENWSLWFDIKIMLRTFSSVVGARGA